MERGSRLIGIVFLGHVFSHYILPLVASSLHCIPCISSLRTVYVLCNPTFSTNKCLPSSCGMHPSGNLFEPNFRGASPAGRQLGFDGNHAGPQSKNSQLFLPDHFFGHAQSTQPSTSESTGMTSSQYSVPLRNPNFENNMVCYSKIFCCCPLFHITS